MQWAAVVTLFTAIGWCTHAMSHCGDTVHCYRMVHSCNEPLWWHCSLPRMVHSCNEPLWWHCSHAVIEVLSTAVVRWAQGRCTDKTSQDNTSQDIRSQGQNAPRDKTSQGQNVPRTKRPKDKKSQGKNVPRDKTSQGTKHPTVMGTRNPRTVCIIYPCIVCVESLQRVLVFRFFIYSFVK